MVLQEELVADEHLEDAFRAGWHHEGGAVHLSVHKGALRQRAAGLRLLPSLKLALALVGHKRYGRGPGGAESLVLQLDGPRDGLERIEFHQLELFEIEDDARDVRSPSRIRAQVPNAFEAVEGLLQEGLLGGDRLGGLELELPLHPRLHDCDLEGHDLVLHNLGAKHLHELSCAAVVVADVRSWAHLQSLIILLGLPHPRRSDIPEGRFHGHLHDEGRLKVRPLLPFLIFDLAFEDVLELGRPLRLHRLDALELGVLVGPGGHAIDGVICDPPHFRRMLRPLEELSLIVAQVELVEGGHIGERLTMLHLAQRLDPRLRLSHRLLGLLETLGLPQLVACLLA
mmetsp:Transcript_102628/g.229195  ORF Transcript_102628/g.229195 Transcript_102628/m.229195 type:complete len:341 (-) Transcript_102628:323-1345(-)